MIKIITALPCEAKPLINYFKLKLVQTSPFLTYENENLILAISGVGSLNASTCVGHLYYKGKDSLWLNIGVAGHFDAKVGSSFLISKMTHENLKRAFYPYLPLKHPFNLSPLQTLESPSQNYLTDTLYDMECYGFYFAALKFSSIERVQAFKIVSDNFKSDIKKITKEKVSSYVEDNLKAIEELINLMMKLKKVEFLHPEIERIYNHYHLTETQKHRLTSHLNLLYSHKPDDTSFEVLKRFSSSKKLLEYLENEIFNLPLIKS